MDMESKNIGPVEWREQLKESLKSASGLAEHFAVNVQEMNLVLERYPMKIPPYYRSLISEKDDPIWRQAVPDMAELKDLENVHDPLAEEPQSPVPSIIHRYPDRVIFLVSNRCAMYCRHCMRKRKIGDRCLHFGGTGEEIDRGLAYIRDHSRIEDVIISGGDPLMLATDIIREILENLKKISHVKMVRIHSRVPCTLPMRITENLVSALKTYRPLYINTHFNHPAEITPEAEAACALLADSGVPLGCQTVLLKGVNDQAETMVRLMKGLIRIRVRPYYLHHPDPVAGTAHFRPSLKTGLEIMSRLRGHISGLCVPQYMIDLPGGNGKVPVIPQYLGKISGRRAEVKNYLGRKCTYIF